MGEGSCVLAPQEASDGGLAKQKCALISSLAQENYLRCREADMSVVSGTTSENASHLCLINPRSLDILPFIIPLNPQTPGW